MHACLTFSVKKLATNVGNIDHQPITMGKMEASSRGTSQKTKLNKIKQKSPVIQTNLWLTSFLRKVFRFKPNHTAALD
jgi:hypothetical protein